MFEQGNKKGIIVIKVVMIKTHVVRREGVFWRNGNLANPSSGLPAADWVKRLLAVVALAIAGIADLDVHHVDVMVMMAAVRAAVIVVKVILVITD